MLLKLISQKMKKVGDAGEGRGKDCSGRDLESARGEWGRVLECRWGHSSRFQTRQQSRQRRLLPVSGMWEPIITFYYTGWMDKNLDEVDILFPT